mgnify:CR=1 FL=1
MFCIDLICKQCILPEPEASCDHGGIVCLKNIFFSIPFPMLNICKCTSNDHFDPYPKTLNFEHLSHTVLMACQNDAHVRCKLFDLWRKRKEERGGIGLYNTCINYN